MSEIFTQRELRRFIAEAKAVETTALRHVKEIQKQNAVLRMLIDELQAKKVSKKPAKKLSRR